MGTKPRTPAEAAIMDAFSYIVRFPTGTKWSLNVDDDNDGTHTASLSIVAGPTIFWQVAALINKMPAVIGPVYRTINALEIELVPEGK